MFHISGNFTFFVKKFHFTTVLKVFFETINYNGLLGSKVPLLSKVGKLPVVDINGERVQDSTRIARYLDQHFSELPRLYPEDPMQCAYTEFGKWADEVLYFYEVHFRVSIKAFNQVVEISSKVVPHLKSI